MFNVTTVSQRLAVARSRRRALTADRAFNGRSSLGETFAVGLGCDSYKAHQA